jgi:hypothetical protein
LPAPLELGHQLGRARQRAARVEDHTIDIEEDAVIAIEQLARGGSRRHSATLIRHSCSDVVQDAPDQFTPFSWSVDGNQNKLLLGASENLKGVKVDFLAAGLRPTETMRLVLDTTDGLSDQVTLKGYPSTPSQIRRDGVVIDQNWFYNTTTRNLILQEWDGTQQHVWDIDP